MRRTTALTLGLAVAVGTLLSGATRAAELGSAPAPRPFERAPAASVSCSPDVVRQIAMAAIRTAP